MSALLLLNDGWHDSGYDTNASLALSLAISFSMALLRVGFTHARGWLQVSLLTLRAEYQHLLYVSSCSLQFGMALYFHWFCGNLMTDGLDRHKSERESL